MFLTASCPPYSKWQRGLTTLVLGRHMTLSHSCCALAPICCAACRSDTAHHQSWYRANDLWQIVIGDPRSSKIALPRVNQKRLSQIEPWTSGVILTTELASFHAGNRAVWHANSSPTASLPSVTAPVMLTPSDSSSLVPPSLLYMSLRCPCSLLYVGRTIRVLRTRVGEHLRFFEKEVDKQCPRHFAAHYRRNI